jgi:acyl-coenzyme A thioesterase PaaI-like protein
MPSPAENHDLSGCFACGHRNPSGLALRFRWENGTAVAETLCRPSWVGWRGMVHGGILAAILDEAMGWAVAERGRTGLTVRITVHLRLPVVPGQQLTVRGWVERWRRRIARTAADLRTPKGTLVASAEALMLLTEELPSLLLHG